MVSIDDRLGEAAPIMARAFGGAFRGPFRGALPRALPLWLAGGLALAALAAGLSSGWLAGPADAALSGSDEVTLASGAASGEASAVPAGACQRIQAIVETACGYKQYDHDVGGIRQCVAYELKYTMWSAYGCR